MIILILLIVTMMMMIIMIIIIIIISSSSISIIITMKGATGGFLTITSLYRKLSPTHTLMWLERSHMQITCNTLGTHHVQHVVCHVVGKDNPATKFWNSCNHIYSNFISLAETTNQCRRGENHSIQRKLPTTSFRKRHTLLPKFSCPSQDKPIF